MKRLLILLLGVMLLVACGDNSYEKELKEAEKRLEEAKEDTQRLEKTSDQIDETSDLINETQEKMSVTEENPVDESIGITATEVAELLAYEALGEGDSITDVIIYDGEIKAVIEISDDAIISDKSIIAETVYSSASDTLLEHDGWEVLTIEFADVGEISMNRNEKETNEYGMDHFPLEKIIGQLE